MTLLELVSALDPVRVTSFVAFVSSVWLLAGWLKRRQPPCSLPAPGTSGLPFRRSPR